jgi:lysophospholipase L1-like esterase
VAELAASDPRLAWWAPQPVDRSRDEVRLDRFPAESARHLAGQIGPLANLRSSPGCGVGIMTDSPWIEIRLARLRHHQMVAQALALEVESGGRRWSCESGDLREHEGDVRLRLPTGLERGGELGTAWCWLPPISTCLVAGIAVADGAAVGPARLPEPRLLALGDSLVQGFSCASTVHTWPHRLAHRLGVAAWNLGVGGIRIEPEVFRWALESRTWDWVVIGLGSNHAWLPADVDAAADRAAALAELALAGGHGRVLWGLPPWKPCEDGKGPPDFMQVRLDQAAGDRLRTVRAALRGRLAAYAPALTLVEDPMPHDPRWYPDGLHPFAPGFARYEAALATALGLEPA